MVNYTAKPDECSSWCAGERNRGCVKSISVSPRCTNHFPIGKTVRHYASLEECRLSCLAIKLLCSGTTGPKKRDVLLVMLSLKHQTLKVCFVACRSRTVLLSCIERKVSVGVLFLGRFKSCTWCRRRCGREPPTHRPGLGTPFPPVPNPDITRSCDRSPLR